MMSTQECQQHRLSVFESIGFHLTHPLGGGPSNYPLRGRRSDTEQQRIRFDRM
jgi:hypothetical protein